MPRREKNNNNNNKKILFITFPKGKNLMLKAAALFISPHKTLPAAKCFSGFWR
jgi:hypothetical protein